MLFLQSNRNRLKYIVALILLVPVMSFAQSNDASNGFQRVAQVLRSNSNYHFYGKPVSLVIESRTVHHHEGLFYYVLGLVLFVALLRLIFYKYVSTLFTLFFRATLRQQQLREQMLQSPLPALLMNLFFMVSGATYLALLAQYYQLQISGSFWMTLLYALIMVSSVYSAKFILLQVAGWIFGIRQVAETYLFAVFLINKMVGIFLLPFIVLMAFPDPALVPVVVTVSYIMLAGMLLYRFMISYRPLRSEIKLNRLHFFLYLCAFEIAPLLLIYKVLLAHVERRF